MSINSYANALLGILRIVSIQYPERRSGRYNMRIRGVQTCQGDGCVDPCLVPAFVQRVSTLCQIVQLAVLKLLYSMMYITTTDPANNAATTTAECK